MGDYPHEQGWMHGPGDGHWIFMLIAFVILVSLAAVAVMAVLRYVNSHQTHSSIPQKSGPADVLKMRFANGEIDQAEFTSRMTALAEHT